MSSLLNKDTFLFLTAIFQSRKKNLIRPQSLSYFQSMEVTYSNSSHVCCQETLKVIGNICCKHLTLLFGVAKANIWTFETENRANIFLWLLCSSVSGSRNICKGASLPEHGYKVGGGISKALTFWLTLLRSTFPGVLLFCLPQYSNKVWPDFISMCLPSRPPRFKL